MPRNNQTDDNRDRLYDSKPWDEPFLDDDAPDDLREWSSETKDVFADAFAPAATVPSNPLKLHYKDKNKYLPKTALNDAKLEAQVMRARIAAEAEAIARYNSKHPDAASNLENPRTKNSHTDSSDSLHAKPTASTSRPDARAHIEDAQQYDARNNNALDAETAIESPPTNAAQADNASSDNALDDAVQADYAQADYVQDEYSQDDHTQDGGTLNNTAPDDGARANPLATNDVPTATARPMPGQYKAIAASASESNSAILPQARPAKTHTPSAATHAAVAKDMPDSENEASASSDTRPESTMPTTAPQRRRLLLHKWTAVDWLLFVFVVVMSLWLYNEMQLSMTDMRAMARADGGDWAGQWLEPLVARLEPLFALLFRL